MVNFSLESRFVRELDEGFLEFIHGDPESGDEERFKHLALKEFEFKYHTSEPYREYCKRKNVTPEAMAHWEEIPAVSSFAFEKVLLASFPTEKAEQIYLASRIVDHINRSEKTYRRKWDIELINTANNLLTKLFLFPDVERKNTSQGAKRCWELRKSFV